VNAGHDYAAILKGWTLPMVIKANVAMDIQEDANRLAHESANPSPREGLLDGLR
jgi:hypothetical protein